MRDPRGRYHSQKPITESVPAWACGCGRCSAGVASAPDLTGVVPLYLERMVQALDKTLTFCDCRAGVAYRSALLNRRQALLEEARRDPRMREAVLNNTHPDIDAARAAVHAAYEVAPPPTMHAQPAPTTAPQEELAHA